MAINIKNAFPTKDQIIIHDVQDYCDSLFDSLVFQLNSHIKNAVSLNGLIEYELKWLERLRDNIEPFYTSAFDNDVNLYPLFKHGWDCVQRGSNLFTNAQIKCIQEREDSKRGLAGRDLIRVIATQRIPLTANQELKLTAFNRAYKFFPEIVDFIKTKYSEKDSEPLYFEKLSKVAIEIITEGMAYAKYYYYIKEEKYRTSISNNEVKNIQLLSKQQTINNKQEEEDVKKPQPSLTMNQISLKYFWEGESMTREHGNDIARQYNHNSGEKLYSRFTFYSNNANRKAIPDTPKKLLNKIELFETVINMLPEIKKQKPIDELNILKQIYDSKYQ